VSEINSVPLQLQVQPQELHIQGCMGDQLLGIHVTTLQLSFNIIRASYTFPFSTRSDSITTTPHSLSYTIFQKSRHVHCMGGWAMMNHLYCL